MLIENQTNTVGPRVLQLLCSNPFEGDQRNSDDRSVPLLLKALHCVIEPRVNVTVATFSRVDGRFELTRRPFPLEPFSAHTGQPLTGNGLWQLVRENDVVHIHQPGSDTGTIGVLVASQSFRRVIVTFTEEEKGDSLLIKWDGLSLVDRAICFSEHSAERLRLLANVGCIDVIRGPVDTEAFFESKCRPQKRRQIICAGPIRHDSGLDLIIRTLPADLRLIVYGPVYERDYLRHLKTLVSGKSVQFVSNIDDKELRDLYEQSLATVAAYQYDGIQHRSEGVGRSLLESMSVGTPVICSRVGALPEYLPGAEAGLVFDDPEELAAILESVATGEWPGADAFPACVAHVRNNFNLAIVGHKLNSLYGDLLRHVCA